MARRNLVASFAVGLAMAAAMPSAGHATPIIGTTYSYAINVSFLDGVVPGTAVGSLKLDYNGTYWVPIAWNITINATNVGHTFTNYTFKNTDSSTTLANLNPTTQYSGFKFIDTGNTSVYLEIGEINSTVNLNSFSFISNYTTIVDNGNYIFAKGTAIPEPTSLALLGLGIVGLSATKRIRARRNNTPRS